jgi:hypothetical protein
MTDAPKIESRTRDDDALPASAIQTELARIVASDAFRRSVRHCHFLRYVVDQRLGGRVGQLKEIEIAVAVFGRRQSAFDSRHDPIVRVEAGRVRERLAQFYALESADSTIEIGIPKGSYLPTFAARTPKEATGLQGTSIAVVPFVEICAPSSEQGLGDGLTDELIDALAQLPEVRVAARTSSYRLKHRTMDARAARRSRSPTSSRAACSIREIASAASRIWCAPTMASRSGPGASKSTRPTSSRHRQRSRWRSPMKFGAGSPAASRARRERIGRLSDGANYG